MKKKALLIFSSALIALLALLPSTSPVSANDEFHYYAYGNWPTDEAPGVSGNNYICDNKVYTGFVAEFVTVYFELDRWIEVGWLENYSPEKPLLYVCWKTDERPRQFEYMEEEPEYFTSHDYKIYKVGAYWKVYIDGSLKKTITAQWSEGDIYAESETEDSATPPVNELHGHFWNLKYRSGSSWYLWNDIDTYTTAYSPYRVKEINSHEFYTYRLIEVEIPLWPEWNMVSLPLIPEDNDIEVVLEDIMDTLSVIERYDAESKEWLYYSPGNPASTLATIDDGLGYWFYMYSSDTLIARGFEEPLPGEPWPAYDVFADDWNQIGFKSTSSMHHSDYLFNLWSGGIPNYGVIYGYNATAQEYVVILPMEEHGGMLDPGYGYWLWATADGTIIPPDGDGGSKSASDGGGAILPDKADLPPFPPVPPPFLPCPPNPPPPPSSYMSGAE